MRILLLAVLAVCVFGQTRKLDKTIVDDVHSNQDAVNKIIELVKNGEFKKRAWDQVQYFTDKFGNRVSGSERLEEAIDWVIAEMKKEGFDSVVGEEVTVPFWDRGEEYAKILTPLEQQIPILGLGSSVGTQNYTDGKLTADVIVVKTFDELEAKGAEVKGKIVVYNEDWTGYGTTVPYRSGADAASKLGAKATLIRSVADFGLHTPHTGQQGYGDNPPIPTACITIEDAALLQRYYDANKPIRIELMMEAVNQAPRTSRNIVAEIRGTEEPEKIVLFGGHIDSWDVGKGVMDDGGGAFISWQVLTIMKKLGLKPRRTLRCVLWTSEEVGLIGAQQYYERHVGDKDNMVILMESDYGIFNPLGIKFDGSGLAKAYMEEVLTLLEPISASSLTTGYEGPDISMWDKEVPKGSLDIENDKYFWYHHTDADTMTMLDPNDIDLCSIVWASVTYTIANLETTLPRTGGYPTTNTAAHTHAAAAWLILGVLVLKHLLCYRH